MGMTLPTKSMMTTGETFGNCSKQTHESSELNTNSLLVFSKLSHFFSKNKTYLCGFAIFFVPLYAIKNEPINFLSLSMATSFIADRVVQPIARCFRVK